MPPRKPEFNESLGADQREMKPSRLVEKRRFGVRENCVEVTRYAYDANGRVQESVTTLESKNGKVVEEQGYPRSVVFRYDDRGRLVEKKWNRIHRRYDFHDNEVVYQISDSHDYAYDDVSGELIMEQHRNDIYEYKNEYDDAGNLVKRVTNGGEAEENFFYDKAGRMIERSTIGKISKEPKWYRMSYDERNRIICEERGFTIDDQQGRRIDSNDKPRGKIIYVYSPDGKKRTTTDWWEFTDGVPHKQWEKVDIFDDKGDIVETTTTDFPEPRLQGLVEPSKSVEKIENKYA